MLFPKSMLVCLVVINRLQIGKTFSVNATFVWLHRTYTFTGARQLLLMSIRSELTGEIWCRLNIGLGLSVLLHRLPMACFSDHTLEFSATERGPGRLLFFAISHLCFFRRYALRKSVLRRTCIMKMKKPCKEMCFVWVKCERNLIESQKSCSFLVFIYLVTLFLQFPTIRNIHICERFLRRTRSTQVIATNGLTIFWQTVCLLLPIIR